MGSQGSSVKVKSEVRVVGFACQEEKGEEKNGSSCLPLLWFFGGQRDVVRKEVWLFRRFSSWFFPSSGKEVRGKERLERLVFGLTVEFCF